LGKIPPSFSWQDEAHQHPALTTERGRETKTAEHGRKNPEAAWPQVLSEEEVVASRG